MKKVLVLMSGGVDSSAAALMLLNEGYDVSGLTLLLQDAASDQDCVHDAQAVCQNLGIEHYTLDLRRDFENNVINYFVSSYLNAKTPNPCVACNKHIKFGKALEFALEKGFDKIATGHYADIRYNNITSRYELLRTASSKDQSYALYTLNQHQLAHILFPLKDAEKADTRTLARKYDLTVASKPDSQDICFIPDGDYVRYLTEAHGVSACEGNFISLSGEIIGKHSGIINYTIGQRKGLGISFGQPMYVTSISSQDNTVTLGPEGSQYRSDFTASDVNLISVSALDEPMRVSAKIRYSAKPAPAVIHQCGANSIRASFDSPQRSVTPGQSVVFYNGDVVVGGGIIE